MSTRKETEANHIFAELLALNDDSCGCPYPHGEVLNAYKMLDILSKAVAFVDPVIFALEYHQRGSRIFFCTSRTHFPHYFFRVRSLKPQYETWHEILSDLNRTNLYFDLEYYTKFNPNLNGQQIGEEFKSALINYLIEYSGKNNKEAKFKNILTTEKIRFVEFDATTDAKFSRHLIVLIENFAFKSSEVVGSFVVTLGNSDFFKEKFKFFDKNGSGRCSLMDFSVYHEGQNLRMLGSPKFGRTNTLNYVNPLEDHEFRFHENCSLCTQMLMNTLATVTNTNDDQLRCISLNSDPILTLNQKEMQHFASTLFPDDETAEFQFTVRTFVCLVLEIKNSLKCSKVDCPAVESLLNRVCTKLETGNTFRSLEIEFWVPILRVVEKFLNAFQLNTPNVDLIRYELGNLLVLLECLPNFQLLVVDFESQQNQKIESVKPKLAKKCRHTMSLLLRLLQNAELALEKDGPEGVDFNELNRKYTVFVHNLPADIKSTVFPEKISLEDFADIKILTAYLSDQEEQIRNDRTEKAVVKYKSLLDALKFRSDEEEQFRAVLTTKMTLAEVKANATLEKLCRLILEHSYKLQFTL